MSDYVVRRLMPVECERLQGFPDGWTDIRKKVFTEVARMAYSGSDYTKAEDLPYIISDVLHHDNMQEEQRIRILNYSLSLAQGLKPVASLKIEINGEAYEESASGDGQYDAFVRALRHIYSRLNRPFPMLTNYSVSIPPGGRTDAFVQTVISWNYAGIDFKTRGLDADQTEAAIKATVKMLNRIEEQ